MRRMSASDSHHLRTAWAVSFLAAATAGGLAHAAWSGVIAAVPAWAGAVSLMLIAVALAESALRALPRPDGDMSTLPMEMSAATLEGDADDAATPRTGADAGQAAAGAVDDPVDPRAARPLPGTPVAETSPGALSMEAGQETAAGTARPELAAAIGADRNRGVHLPALQSEPSSAAEAAVVPDPSVDALREALATRALRLVYQPVIDLTTRRVHAVEVLLRWPRASGSPTAAEDILDAADRAGIGSVLGQYVIEAACQQMARWQQVLGDSAPQRISIRLTRRQCLEATLQSRLEDALRVNALRPSALQIELAATSLVGDDELQQTLRPLRAAGVAVALERFGTGASSLGGLRELPIDLVKVDPGIVQRAESGGAPHLVLESTLRVASSLGLAVVAAGVETRAQLDLLCALGCKLVQGPALCAPVDAIALTRRLRSGDCLPRGLAAAPCSAASLSA